MATRPSPATLPELSRAEKLDWLQLTRSDGVGPTTFFRLLRRFGTASAVLEALPRLIARGRAETLTLAVRGACDEELVRLERLGGRLLVHEEAAYPPLLREIDDPPPVLSVRGRAETLAIPGVAVVGARNASGGGCLIAKRMGHELAEHGVAVISGLARGIDTAAHEGAVEAGGITIAVIATGVDIAYPDENAGLMERIAETGAVVSSRPLGAPPQARHFPKRNRLISGLAHGVVIVEAAPQSGSLITARLALEQNREVMAVPGTPLDPRHRGTNQLLRDGAHLVESAADVMAVLGDRLAPSRLVRDRHDQTSPAPAPAPARQPATSDRLESLLLARLGPEPLLVDELIRQCHASAAVVQHALLELELAGRIERHAGNRVSRANV